MEVILLERVSKLGKTGDVVNVKPGFARNFLIPTSKALRATEENKLLFEARRKELEKETLQKIEESKKHVTLIDGKFVTLIRQAGEDGRLFGSVTTRDISTSLNNLYKSELNRSHVIITTPVKYIGIYEIEILLHAEVSTKIFLNVARTEDEAIESKKNHLKPVVKSSDVSDSFKKPSKKKIEKAEENEEAEDVEDSAE